MAGNISRGNDLGIGQGKGLKIITLAGLVFLLLPLLVLIVYSFNESRTVTVWTGFSLKWYRSVFQDPAIWLAVKNSLVIAVVSTFFTTVLGTMGALLLSKYTFRGKDLFQNMLYVPVLLPEIIFGVMLLAMFLMIGFPLGLISIICAHITFSFPFATMIIYAKVVNMPASIEEASLDLGASRWQTYLKVVLPFISPGIISGAMFAFTMSIDDFVVTFFTAGVGSSTLPLKIYSLIKFGVTPSINAISTLLIVFTVIVLFISNRIQESKRLGKKFKITILSFFILLIIFLIASPFFNSDEKKLNIYNYSGYLSDKLINDFEKESGIKVTLDYYNDNEELLSRLKMGVSGYDLIFPTGYMVKIMKESGLLSPIDYKMVPNYQYVTPIFRTLPYDTTGLYYIPYAYGFTGMVYNSEMIKDTVNSWKAMWDPKYQGKILMIDEMRETFYVAFTLLGKPFSPDTAVLNQARDLLIRQRPLLKKYESNAIEERMISGDAWIAHAWNGLTARLVKADPKFKSVMPSEGVVFWVDNICIPAGAPHKENALLFINFLLKPENTAKNIQTIMYAMPNEQARALLDSSLKNNKVIFPDLNDSTEMEVLEDYGNFNQMLDKAWTEVKTK